MRGLTRKILKSIEYLRPGVLVPKGAVFVAKVGSQYKIIIPQDVRDKLNIRHKSRIVVFLRVPVDRIHFGLKYLQPLVYRLRPGLLFPKGLRFEAQVEEDSWRFTIPKHLHGFVSEGMEIDVYIRVYGTDAV